MPLSASTSSRDKRDSSGAWRIRDAAATDADAIAAIFNESVVARGSTMQLEPVAPEVVRQWVRTLSDREALLVADESGDAVGWGILKRYSDREGYRFTAETSVYVRHDMRGLGLGTAMQRALLERARSLRYHHLVARIWATHEHSLVLHRNFGYELVGVQREVGFVDGEWHDVAILQKLLAPDHEP